MQLHDMRKSSSSRSGRTFGPCPSIPRSDLGPTTCFPPWRCLSKQGSRVSPYKKTAEDPPYKEAESPVCYFQSISAMTVYSNKSHEELRHEDYQIQNKGLPGKGSRVSPYKKTADDPCNEAGSSASKKKEAGSPNWYFQSISAMPVYSSKSHEELRYEDYQIQHKGGVMTNPAPLKTKAAFSPNSLISTSPPTSRQENVFSNTAAAYATSSEATSTSSTFGQKVSTTFTESGSSSDAHSEPSLSPHAHCTSAKVDYPNNAIELLLPTSISLKIAVLTCQLSPSEVTAELLLASTEEKPAEGSSHQQDQM
ncbi:hypothetical protein EJB05_30387, partial [Eragrostis curvula]